MRASTGNLVDRQTRAYVQHREWFIGNYKDNVIKTRLFINIYKQQVQLRLIIYTTTEIVPALNHTKSIWQTVNSSTLLVYDKLYS